MKTDNDVEGFLQTLRRGGIEGFSIDADELPYVEPTEAERFHIRSRIHFLTVEVERLRDRLHRLESHVLPRPVSER